MGEGAERGKILERNWQLKNSVQAGLVGMTWVWFFKKNKLNYIAYVFLLFAPTFLYLKLWIFEGQDVNFYIIEAVDTPGCMCL